MKILLLKMMISIQRGISSSSQSAPSEVIGEASGTTMGRPRLENLILCLWATNCQIETTVSATWTQAAPMTSVMNWTQMTMRMAMMLWTANREKVSSNVSETSKESGLF